MLISKVLFCSMKYFVALFILVNICLDTKAQFHTIASRPLHNKMEKVNDRPKSETVGVKDSLAMEGKIENMVDRDKWLERYMSVSLPLEKIKVTSPYGMRNDPFTGKKKMHYGLDLRADRSEVYAMMHGIVEKAGQDRVSGKHVTVRHWEFSVSYCHLSECHVKRGDCVKPGDVVGKSGSTGRSTSPHLHLAVRMGRRHINPEILLQFIGETRRQALEKLSE